MSARRPGLRLAVVIAAIVLATPAWGGQQPASLERARALYDERRLDEARTMLADLARTQGGDPEVHLLLGVVERTAGHLPEAIASFERARAIDATSVRAAVELATTLAWHGDLARAVALYREVLGREPSHLGALVGLGYALAWQGRLDEAKGVFRDLVGANPRSVDAWNGLGFVDRASLHRTDAESAYRRALEIDPQNADATAGLKELYWDRRTDVRVLGGGSVVPGGRWEPEARLDATYAINPQVTIGGGYQHYAFGAVLPIGGAEPAGTRSEDSLEASVLLRPSRRFTLGNSLYTFFGNGTSRGMLWEEAVFAVTPKVSLTGVLRPAFSSDEPRWLFAGAGGASIALTGRSRLNVRALVAADTAYEPRLTLLGDLTAAFSRRFEVQLSVANSNTDDRFAFTSVAVGGRWLITPAVGLSVLANHRTRTFERSEVLFGIVVRR